MAGVMGALGDVGQWWDELQELGYDVRNMSARERSDAAIDVGLQTASQGATGLLGGLAGATELYTSRNEVGGDAAVDQAVGRLNQTMEMIPQRELQTGEGERLSRLLQHAGKPAEYVDEAFMALGDKAMEATGSPEFATMARMGLGFGMPIAGGAAALSWLMRQGGKGTRPNAPRSQVGAIGEFEAGTDVTHTPETQLSTRYPTAVSRTEDPHGNEILLSGDIGAMDPKTLNKNLSAVTQYPGLKGRLKINSNPDRVMSEFLDLTRSNMQRVFDEMPDKMRDAAKQWYDGANKIRTGLASHYDISPEASSGVIAALSPQNPWDNNLAAAERVIDTYKNNQDTRYTPEMEAQYKKRVKASKDGKSAWDKKDNLIGEIRGKRLQDLQDPRHKAAWIRLFDEAHNTRDYFTWSPEGKRVRTAQNDSGTPAKMSWGSFDEIESAVDILDNPSLENISTNMGLQHKVRNFYNNIENPNSMLPFYTSDTHNVSAALLRPLGGSSTEVMQSFGGKGSGTSGITGHRGTYPLYAKAGEDVAAANKLMPRETQSIVWEAIRNIFTNKSDALKKEANQIWIDYSRGKLSMEQAQDRIIEASGGFKTPDWAK